jgi:RNA polymerase sigma-70 factor (ECF subfamily)
MRDAQSFDEFYRSTAKRMLRYGYAVVGDHTEAQDLVQEAFARAWRQWRTLVDHPAPEAGCAWWSPGWPPTAGAGCAAGAPRSSGPATEPVRPPNEDTVLLVAALRHTGRAAYRRSRCTTSSTCP